MRNRPTTTHQPGSLTNAGNGDSGRGRAAIGYRVGGRPGPRGVAPQARRCAGAARWADRVWRPCSRGQLG
ncbi:MAG: hypothetical protein B7X34_04150, partial [Acidobacteriia bacterium 12-62-4]